MRNTRDVYVKNVNVCREDGYKTSLLDILNIEPYYMEIKQTLENIYCCTVDNLDEMSKCIKWLQNNKFKNFVVKKIYVSRIRSEIYVIADFDDGKIGEVLDDLNCIHGALLRMNRSIQSEGANGIIKWNRSYTRARRRGLNAMNLEIAMICCGFNLHKFHLKKIAIRKAA